jgi:hypothetical protein
MARSFVMLRREQLASLMEQHGAKREPLPPSALPPLVQPLSLGTDSEGVQKGVLELLELLPKNYRNRAKSLLKFLEPHLSIDQNKQLVFTHQGQVFSSLWDLAFFLFDNEAFGRPSVRPLDAVDFLGALVDLKVPLRLLSTKKKYMRKVMRLRSVNKKR